MAKDPFEVVTQALLSAGQEAGLGSIERYAKDTHYQATIDRTVTVAVNALQIEPVEQSSPEGAQLYRIHGLEE